VDVSYSEDEAISEADPAEGSDFFSDAELEDIGEEGDSDMDLGAVEDEEVEEESFSEAESEGATKKKGKDKDEEQGWFASYDDFATLIERGQSESSKFLKKRSGGQQPAKHSKRQKR
jgi:hypothetical protein